MTKEATEVSATWSSRNGDRRARAAAGPADVETLCERVSEAMNAEDAPDDVALLALSLAGETPTANDP